MRIGSKRLGVTIHFYPGSFRPPYCYLVVSWGRPGKASLQHAHCFLIHVPFIPYP